MQGTAAVPRLAKRQYVRRGLALASFVVVSSFLALLLTRNIAQLGVIEQWLLDWRVTFFAPPSEPRTDIALIKIDEETLDRLAYRSPIDRGFLADILDRLAAAKVRGVAIDVLLDRPTEPAKDARLRARMLDFPAPLVIAWADAGAAMTAVQHAYLSDYGKGLRRGYANLLVDRLDGTVRWINVRHEGGTEPLPGLAAALAEAVGVSLPEGDLIVDYLRAPDPRQSVIPAFSAWQFQFLPPQFFAGKLVLIGGDYASEDRYRTPFAAGLGDLVGRMPGVLIHAHALAQLIDGRRAYRIDPMLEAAFVLAAALSAMALGLLNLSVASRALIGLGGIVAILSVGLIAFSRLDLALPILSPSLAFVFAGTVTSFYQQRRFAKERAFIREALSRYVPRDVVKMLEADPSRLKLGGDRHRMTFVFSDVAGFTTLAEQAEPTRLLAVLNRYLDGMSGVVLAHGGTLDKYVGDAVVAIFGAFKPEEAHQQMAVGCALAMDRYAGNFAREIRASGLDFGDTRIGVNTGPALIGNIGGENRFDFTAIGDPVNAASRLEGANKYFGTRVVVGESTVRDCVGIAFRPVGEVLVKGKAESMVVFEPLAEDRAELRFLAEYLAAYEALERGDPKAKELFAALSERMPEDGLVQFHHRRITAGESGIKVVLLDK